MVFSAYFPVCKTGQKQRSAQPGYARKSGNSPGPHFWGCSARFSVSAGRRGSKNIALNPGVRPQADKSGERLARLSFANGCFLMDTMAPLQNEIDPKCSSL